MAAPLKPWEKAGVNNQHHEMPLSNAMSSSLPDVTVLGETANRSIPASAPTPPPLPPRPGAQQGASGYSSLGYGGYGGSTFGGYGGYGGGMYGSSMYGSGMYGSAYGGGMYGGYGGYGSGMYGAGYGGAMNRYGADAPGYGQNSFVRQAEENSRQAFQSVESVVHAFGSVAMMLESTFYAVFNSFRAVIGVADQMGRVKAHFAQIFSALAVIRTLRWLYRKLLVMLRLRKGGLPEDAWQQATTEGVQAVLAEQELQGGKKSNWPIMLFYAVVLGGPWLIWRLLSSMYSTSESNSRWMDGTDDHFMAVGEYSFSAQGEQELSFRRGQKIVVAPKEVQPQIRGWLLACVDGKKTGLVPANYIKILGKKKGSKQDNQVVSRQHAGTSAPQLPTANSSVNLDNEFNSSAVSSSPSFEQAFSSNRSITSPASLNSIPRLQEQTASDILDNVSPKNEEPVP